MSASANQLSTSFALPVDTRAMEAKLADAIPSGEGVWQYEPKWDGFRCLAFKAGDAVDIRAKSGKPLGRYFPELVELLRGLEAPEFVVDGEIVIELSGAYSFDALQMRLHPAESRDPQVGRRNAGQAGTFRHVGRRPGPDSHRSAAVKETDVARGVREILKTRGHRALAGHFRPRRG